ncbi:ABC transporter permease [Planococcus sp. CPCC 101016]|uniref:ABC transporter permease n=1 Tax=Planococcus sp. CPCC 101016 TaxID=2599617 RepID=UPI0011B50858|nr:ABC transporter permease [Planococcus sp. CPCC 101016]TWT05564.1 ABC transporter permease [Planococcus sp. CPCC 101016]
MYTFLKKDILVLFRDRTELAVLLAMPFILIAILGFALSGLLSGNSEVLSMDVAIVQEDNEQLGLEQFAEELNGSGIPAEARSRIMAAAQETSPSSILQGILTDESLRELVTAQEMDTAAAAEALEEEEVVAILTIPENFTLNALQKMLMDTGGGAELELMIADHAATQSEVFTDILEEFVWSLNFESAIAQAANGEAPAPEETSVQFGGVESVSAVQPISSFQYYTIGMAVMFALFVGATISGIAFVEKQQFVLNRILLSDQHPFVYLGAKAISAATVTFLQFCILFFFSSLLFGAFDLTNWSFWPGMLLIGFTLAICVGALAAFLTALTMRFNNDSITTVFAGGVVTIFAFLGGSFTPTEGMPDSIQKLGGWTPNGASLNAFLIWLQNLEIVLLWEPLSRVLLLTIVLLILSLLIFPRKGEA